MEKKQGNHQVWQIIARFDQARTYKCDSKAPTVRAVPTRFATFVVLDMDAVVHMVVHMMQPISAYSFADYVTQHIVSSLEYHITSILVDCIDVITTWTTASNLSQIRTRTPKRNGSLSSVNILPRKIQAGNSFSIPNVILLFPTNYPTTQHILRPSKDMPSYCAWSRTWPTYSILWSNC